jgi:hypothetical protein
MNQLVAIKPHALSTLAIFAPRIEKIRREISRGWAKMANKLKAGN